MKAKTQKEAVLSLEVKAPTKAEVDSDEIEAANEEVEDEVILCLPPQAALPRVRPAGKCECRGGREASEGALQNHQVVH